LIKTQCTPPKADAELVYRREDILQTYRRTYRPRSPGARLDEARKPSVAAVDVSPQLGSTSVIASPRIASGATCDPLLQWGTAVSPDNPRVVRRVPILEDAHQGRTSLMIHHKRLRSGTSDC
jgi:hypothetical protein